MWKEFKEFAIKGNVIDLAVGIIIGAAFGTIVKSLVDDIIMPPIGLIVGNVDFSELFFKLRDGNPLGPYNTIEEAKAAGAVTVYYGNFINNIVTFIIVSFSVFLLVKTINKLKRKEEDIPPQQPTVKDCPYCLTKISIKATRCPACTSEMPVNA